MSSSHTEADVLRWVLNQKEVDIMLRPELVGYLLQIFLHGACLATSVISPAFSTSTLRTKLFLILLICLTTVYTGIRSTVLATLTVAQYRDAAYLSSVSLAAVAVTLFYIAIIAVVQLFYAVRVVSLIQSKLAYRTWLGVFVLTFTMSLVGWSGIIQMAMANYLGLHSHLNMSHSNFLETYGVMFHYFASALIDILISATLAHQIRRDRVTLQTKTGSICTRLLRTSMATGALTSITASVTALVHLAYELKLFKSPVALALSFPLPSLYCLSIFWTLDLRSQLRQEREASPIELSLNLEMTVSETSTAKSEDTKSLERPPLQKTLTSSQYLHPPKRKAIANIVVGWRRVTTGINPWGLRQKETQPADACLV